MGKSLQLPYANVAKLSKTVGVVHKKCVYIKSVDPSSSISAILASSSSRLPVSAISASSSFSFMEHLLVANGHARMIQESDVSYTTSIYVTQSWCIPDEIALCYFQICVITHNNNFFNKTSLYSHSKFCPQKKPILIASRFVRYRFFAWNLTRNSFVRQWFFL